MKNTIKKLIRKWHSKTNKNKTTMAQKHEQNQNEFKDTTASSEK